MSDKSRWYLTGNPKLIPQEKPTKQDKDNFKAFKKAWDKLDETGEPQHYKWRKTFKVKKPNDK